MRSSFSHPKSGPPRTLESEVGGGCLPYCPQNCDLWKGHVSKNLFFFDDHLKCMHESHHLKPGKKSDLFKDPPHKTKKKGIYVSSLGPLSLKEMMSSTFLLGLGEEGFVFYLLCSLRSLPLIACLLDKARELLLEPAQLTESQSPKLLFFPNRTCKPHQSKLRRLTASHQNDSCG